jgi:hypothetical protein
MTETISQALQEAQKTLLQKQAAVRQLRLVQGLPVDRHLSPGASQYRQQQLNAEEFPQPSMAEQISSLPAHLGWGSVMATAVIRTALKRHGEQREEAAPSGLDACLRHSSQPADPPKSPPQIADNNRKQVESVKLYPDIALGMLRQEQAPAGRIWLLLRAMDAQGRGWLYVDDVRALLTRKGAQFRVCGWRHLRNLLHDGEGLFWHRDKERIWLHSAANVAISLEVARLTGRPVALPVEVLLKGIGTVRAHFYASFHSGRKHDNPVSRATLEDISGVNAPVQRYYEKATGVRKQRNLAVGEQYTDQNVQNRAWHHGSAVFDFIDHHGRQGPEKRHYVAWWLPNSYEGCHQNCPKGRMKKINRQIALVKNGRRGTVCRTRLFHHDGAGAAKAHRRSDGTIDMYWFNEHGRRKPYKLWYSMVMEGG